MKNWRLTLAVVVMLTAAPSAQQWFKYPTPGIPRLPDGKANLAAPAPRSADGKPDFSGVWQTQGIFIGNLTKDLKPEDVPMHPWAEALHKTRLESHGKDDPTGKCVVGGVPRSTAVPYPFKILHSTSGSGSMLVILYEAVHSYRQIFTDGRPLPKDPNPQWFGYSVGKWDGDTLVVDSAGFNDNVWLDNNGRPATEQLKVTEKFTRKDFGHMNVAITIDDPKTYKKPWTVNIPLIYQPDTEMIEYMCPENEKDYERLVGK